MTTLTSHEGDFVTPAGQFILRSSDRAAGRVERTALPMHAATGRIGIEITPATNEYDLVRGAAKIALEAADREAAALRRTT